MDLLREQDIQEHRLDTGRAAALGSLRAIATTLGSLILYRLLLTHHGLELIGLWSMMNVLIAILSFTDLGFSQLLVRSFPGNVPASQVMPHLLDKRAASLFFRFALLVTVVPIPLGMLWWLPAIPYDRSGFTFAMAISICACFIKLEGKLDCALLAASQENARVQRVEFLGYFLFLILGVAGTIANRPLEGIALGNLAAAAFILIACRRRVADHGWVLSLPVAGFRETLTRAIALARQGGYFVGISIGSTIREGVFRTTIAFFLGLPALGLFSIAFRASVATRDAVANGFSALFPSMAALHRTTRNHEITSLQAASLVFLATFGGAALLCLYGFATPILTLCLSTLPAGVVSATRILVVWNLLTLFNIPFDYLLYATGHERTLAISLWLHTLAIVALWPVCMLWQPTLQGLLVFWLVSSLGTQVMICFEAQRQLKSFWPVMSTPPVPSVIGLTLACFAATVAVTSEHGSRALSQFGWLGPDLFMMALMLGFLASAVHLSWNSMRRFWPSTRATPADPRVGVEHLSSKP